MQDTQVEGMGGVVRGKGGMEGSGAQQRCRNTLPSRWPDLQDLSTQQVVHICLPQTTEGWQQGHAQTR
jgi:hypothetical protein